MAFALRITAKTKLGQEVEINPSWWNKDELRQTHKFKKEINHNYLNYFLYVNKQTFLDIIESQDIYRNKGIYGYERWIKINDHVKAELEDLIHNLKEGSTIKIWIYEWESGLD